MVITKYLKIADFIISISIKGFSKEAIEKNFFSSWVVGYYYGFIVSEEESRKVDFNVVVEMRQSIGVVEQNKDKKKNTYLLFYEEVSRKKIRTYDDISVFQFQLILRKILQKLLVSKQGLIMHGSAVALGDSAIFFSGRSGAGKSTIKNILKDSFMPLADDKVIIRKIKAKWWVFQTPFFEKTSWFYRDFKPYALKAILIPQKSQQHEIKFINDDFKKFEFLIKQTFTEKEDFNTQLKTIQMLANSNIKLGKIYFSLDRKKVIELLKSYADKTEK